MHDIIKIINKGKNQNINWNIGINDESLNIKLSFTKPNENTIGVQIMKLINQINAIIGLADAYYDLKKIEKAIEMYEKVL